MDSSESESSEPFPPVFQNYEKDFKFLGRDWVFTKLTKHLSLNLSGWSTSKNVILFLGEIGSGKTTLLRQLVQTTEFKNQTLAYCECDENTDDCSFVLELVKQLKLRIPYLKIPTYLQLEKDKQNAKIDYSSSNDSLFNEVVDQEDDKFFKQQKKAIETQTDDIFWTHFLFPLIEHGLNRWGDEERFLIFIDSVDLKQEIFDLIVKHLHLLPKFLYLILTARPRRQSNLFKKLHDSRKILLDDMRKQHVLADMKAYVHHQLERLRSKRAQLKEYTIKILTNQLSIKSNGCYFFIKFFVDYAEKEIFNLESDLSLGCTIHGLFLAVFAKLFENKDKKTQHFYKSILSLALASTNNQLNKSILNSLFINPSHVDNALKDLEHFQLIYLSYNEDGDTLINLTNYPVQKWLSDIKLASRRYFSNANFGHLLLINTTPSLSVGQLCYQIDRSNFPVFDLEHKLIWLLLESDTQQFNLLQTQASVSEVAKEVCAYRSRLHKNDADLDAIFANLFSSNVIYENLRTQLAEPGKEKSVSLVNLTKNKMPSSGILDAKVLSTFSKLTLHCIEPDVLTEKRINQDYDVINLMKAIENMDLELTKRILNANGNIVNKHADDDLTPLFYAIRTENKQLVELLIEYNVDVNLACEDDRQTPLMLAVQLNLIDIVLILLENDADLQTTNIFGQSAIVYAILYKSKARLIELLLFWGSNTDYLDSDGRSLLSLACVNADSDLEIVRLLLTTGLDLFHQDKYGKSILHLASVHATNYELTQYLVEVGREELICLQDNEGKMAITYAVIYGCNLMLPLLSCERSLNSMSLDGCSPLRTATMRFQYDCLHTLIDCCGADVNSLDLNGRTTLYYLASICEDNADILEMMKELIKLGANLELCASDSRTTALHISCFKGFEKTVALLLSAGAEVSAVDSEQRNALHMVCASTGNTNIMRKLIEHGIEIDAYTSQGATPLIIATQQGQYDACKLLLEYGANVWHRDETGQNVRDILISYNHGFKMRKLFEKYFGIIGNSDYDVSFDSSTQQAPPKIYPEVVSPVSNSNPMNLSSTHNLSFNLSIDRDDGQTCNSMQGEGRSWIEDSVDNLASYHGSGHNLSNCSPIQSTYNMNYFNSATNLKMGHPLGGSHNHLVANPKLLSPNCFQRSDSSDLTKKDKRTHKFSRFF